MRILISGFMIMVLVPWVAVQCLSALYRKKKISIYAMEYAGRNLTRVLHRTVMINNRALVDLDSWLHYLKGDLDLIGPERLQFSDAVLLTSIERGRFKVAPGFISPYKIKKNSGVAYAAERDVAVEFAITACCSRRFQLLVSWGVQLLTGSNRLRLKSCRAFDLFGVVLSNVTMNGALKLIMQSLGDDAKPKSLAKFAFVNADCGNHFYKDLKYKEILNDFDQVFPDGVGVKFAARMRGFALKENVNGTDMFPLLCERLQRQSKSIYLLGATKSVVRRTVANLRVNFPRLRIAGYSDGYSYVQTQSALCARINRSDADLLLVAMGAPRQERWIAANAPLINVKAVMGVGGLFDFYSGEVSRAPIWMRELSIEWVWRLLQQPEDKFKRYVVGNPLFLFRSAYSLARGR